MYQHQFQDRALDSGTPGIHGSRFQPLSEDECRARFGEFTWNLFAKFGLTELVLSLATNREPGLQTAYALEELSLPILGKLLLLRDEYGAVPVAQVRPLLFLPVSEWLENEGGAGAISQTKRVFEREFPPAMENRQHLRFQITLDRWYGKFAISDLQSVVQEVVALAPRNIRLLGPSAKDVKDALLLNGKNPNDDKVVRDYLREQFVPMLESLDIDTIYGGTSLRTHRFANELGLRSFITHDMNIFRLGRPTSAAPRFTDQLLAIRKEILPKPGACAGWIPLFRAVLDRTLNATENPLGLEALKAVALARLLLPEIEFVQAPIALFGHKAADLAVRFGANDLGVVAVNDETANHLEIPKMTDVEELFSTTPVKLHYSEDLS